MFHLSNGKVEPVNLPVFLIQGTETSISYNDVDVKALLREVRTQASRVILEIKNSEFMGPVKSISSFWTSLLHAWSAQVKDILIMGVHLYTPLQTR